jgi:hypothetical protein
MMHLFFKLHKKFFGYPCREHVRRAMYQGKAKNPIKYRVAMLYLCGYNIEEIATNLNYSRERIRQTLTIICLGVE